MKAIEAFQHLPTTREQIETFSEQLIRGLESGDIEPLKFKVFLNGLDKVFANVKPLLDKMARDEAELHGKSFDYMGAKVELREAGTRYDYSGCGFPKWERANAELKAKQEEVKVHEKFLQSLQGPIVIADEDTGEIITIYPPVKKSTSTIQITMK
jgi:hypothetical protein